MSPCRQATFQHPNDIYREYEAEEENTPQNLGTLRLRNFANCKDGRFLGKDDRGMRTRRPTNSYTFTV